MSNETMRHCVQCADLIPIDRSWCDPCRSDSLTSYEWIVRLARGVYLASTSGDSGGTFVLRKAKRWGRKSRAKAALTMARKLRLLADAEVVRVRVRVEIALC